MSYYNGNSELRFLGYVAPDTFQDSHFFQAVETISLSDTTWLPATINSLVYGCDWDGCNNNSLSQYFPESFQMNINSTILNSQLLNGQLPAQTCYSCSACIHELTVFLCQSQSCTNGSCYIDEIHNYILTPTNNCSYNFYSICQPFASTPNVRIRATYYIDLPENQLEIDEVDITCKKDICNSIEIVEYLKGQIQTTVNIHPDFQQFRPNDTTTTTTIITTTTGASASTTTTGATAITTTTTAGTATATVKGSIIFLYLIPFLLLL
jgi:hypothetical protein